MKLYTFLTSSREQCKQYTIHLYRLSQTMNNILNIIRRTIKTKLRITLRM